MDSLKLPVTSKSSGAKSYTVTILQNVVLWFQVLENSGQNQASFKDIKIMIDELREECKEDKSGNASNSMVTTFNLLRAKCVLEDDLPSIYSEIKKLMTSNYSDVNEYSRSEKKISDMIKEFGEEMDRVIADKASIRLSYFLEVAEELSGICKKIAGESKKQDRSNIYSMASDLCECLEKIGARIDECTSGDDEDETDGEALKCLQLQYTDGKKFIHQMVRCAKISVSPVYKEIVSGLI